MAFIIPITSLLSFSHFDLLSYFSIYLGKEKVLEDGGVMTKRGKRERRVKKELSGDGWGRGEVGGETKENKNERERGERERESCIKPLY